MTKEEQFDQYIQAQFQGESAVPPSRVEEAVFSELAAAQGRQRRGRIGLGMLAVGICTVATMWLSETLETPESPETPETPETSQAIPAASPENSQAVLTMETHAEATSAHAALEVPEVAEASAPGRVGDAEETSTPRATGEIRPVGQEIAGPRPGHLEPTAARGAAPVAIDPADQQPELKLEQTETWVMPANVKVKE